MFAPSIPGRVCPNARRACTSPIQRFTPSTVERRAAFTLMELLVVMAIIGITMLLLAPAFTTIKAGSDVTSAAYTIKGVLDTARTYAKANNTYTWVGFYEEDVSQPSISHGTDQCTGCVGRVVMSIVASKDGTTVYDPNNLTTINPTKLIQVGKLTKIDNAHMLTHQDTPDQTGQTLDTRPNVATTYCIGNSSPPATATPFQYPVGNPAPSPQYTFMKALQFSPGGEARVNNNSNSLQKTAEVGLTQTHGTFPSIPPLVNGKYAGNVVAIQVSGIGGGVIIYRK
jgi:prepilin-type N-terminal cleavage/methylation domain-containing protein